MVKSFLMQHNKVAWVCVFAGAVTGCLLMVRYREEQPRGNALAGAVKSFEKAEASRKAGPADAAVTSPSDGTVREQEMEQHREMEKRREMGHLLGSLQTLKGIETNGRYQMAGGRAYELLADKAPGLAALIEGQERKAAFEQGIQMRLARVNPEAVQQRLLKEGGGRKLSSDESILLEISFGKSLELAQDDVAPVAAMIEQALQVMSYDRAGYSLAALARRDMDAALAILQRADQAVQRPPVELLNMAFMLGNGLVPDENTLTALSGWLQNSNASIPVQSSLIRGAFQIFRDSNPAGAERLKAMQAELAGNSIPPPAR